MIRRYLPLLALLCAPLWAADQAPAPVVDIEPVPVRLTLPPPPPPVRSLPLSPGVAALPDAPPDGFRTYGDGLPLREYLKLALGDLAKVPYVLTSDVLAADSLIAADLSRLKTAGAKTILSVVSESLASSGFALRKYEGVYFVERSGLPPRDSELFVYTPRHRSVSDLAGYFPMFERLRFTTTPAQTDTAYSGVDRDPGRLVVRGPSSDIAAFKELLAQVDTPAGQVVINAHIIEVREVDSRDAAISVLLDLLRTDVSVSSTAPGIAATDVLRLVIPNLSVSISNLTTDSRVRLLSSPVLRASHGSTASAVVGTETPTLGAIVSQNGATQQSVSYQSSGVILRVSPRIFDESVRLDIEAELSSFVKTETGLATTPTKLRRSFKSDVIATPGEALLLGGLSESSETASRSSGWFSFARSRGETSSQVVVLLQVDKL